MTYHRGRESFVGAVGDLIGHIAATALLFVVIMAATWAISWAFSYLNEIHRFPAVSQTILTYLEVILLGIDALVCVALVSYGARRFIHELGRM
jgi:hypothetical protein